MKMSLLEFFLRGIPEGLIFVYATYVFSKKAVRIRPFLLSSILLAIAIYAIRLLPIHVGINNLLNIVVLTFLSVKVNGIDFIKSIKAVFASMLLGFICEGINVALIQFVFKADINYVFSVPMLKILYGIPSLLILALITFAAALFNKKKAANNRTRTTDLYNYCGTGMVSRWASACY
jgi:hypothetical protein